ncbi:hypothetical protein GJ744_002672 [Endocarpon pusillum]|uniref:Uncharacterized protein n=1 Tax=Endocarpon pusillum TaxID=364733 RepID=A0A8H7E104_9EURO|nr:hypothetical protein GJ744_002672 [Endocarpon pusillum]
MLLKTFRFYRLELFISELAKTSKTSAWNSNHRKAFHWEWIRYFRGWPARRKPSQASTL